MIPQRRGLALLAALAGLSGVIMAALGAHAVEGIGDFSRYRSWQSANLMHLVHAVALLGLAALAPSQSRGGASLLWGLAGLVMVLGVLLFSGSIYLSILQEQGGTGGFAPFGGGLLMLGWLIVAVAAITGRGPESER